MNLIACTYSLSKLVTLITKYRFWVKDVQKATTKCKTKITLLLERCHNMEYSSLIVEYDSLIFAQLNI